MTIRRSSRTGSNPVPPSVDSVPPAERKARTDRRPSRSAVPDLEKVAPLDVSHPRVEPPRRAASAALLEPSALLQGNLPNSYGRDRLVVLRKDPEWTHLYWDFSEETLRNLPTSGSLRLRGFDTTGLHFDGLNAPVSIDIEVAPYARSWYVRLPFQGRVYTFELGSSTPDGSWHQIARSTPIGFDAGAVNGSSETWISLASEELFRLSAGLPEGEGLADLIRRLRERAVGGSGEAAGAAWLTSMGSGMGRIEIGPSSFQESSGSLSAAVAERGMIGSFSGASGMGGSSEASMAWSGLPADLRPPVREAGRSRDFWLWVETELILYGATEPDAKVTLRGKPIELAPDGTFRFRFPFSAGTEYLLDVKAVDRSGEQERTAAPAARRWNA